MTAAFKLRDCFAIIPLRRFITLFEAIVVAVLAIVIFSQPIEASPNLITNGGFESTPLGTNWYAYSGTAANSYRAEVGSAASYSVSSSPGGGTYICDIEFNDLSPTTLNDYIRQTITTTAGERYFLSTYATSRPSQTNTRFYLEGAGVSSPSLTTTDIWALYNHNFQATSSSSDIRLISNGSASGIYPNPGDAFGTLLDGVNVQELTYSPSSLSTYENTSVSTTNTLQVATNLPATLTVTLSVSNGTLNLNSVTGITFSSGANNSASMTITGTPTAVNNALLAGVVYTPNTGFTGSDTLNYTANVATSPAVSDTDSIPITVTRRPRLTLTKTSNGMTGAFTFSGTNWSGQTITTTTSGTAVTGTTQLLTVPNTATTINETLNSSFFMSSASCTGLGSGTATVNTASGTISLDTAATAPANDIACSIVNTAANPQLSLTKSTTTSSVSAAGTVIPYTITVANTGNVTVSSMTVTDALGAVTCPTSGNATIASLAPNATQACTMNYTVPQSVMNSNGGGDGTIDNTASVSGTYATQTITASDSNSVNITINQNLSISKSANTAGPVAAGSTITYTFTVTNTGNVTLNNVTVDDPAPGTGTWSGAGNETLSTDAPPTGDSTDAVPNNGVWSVLAPNDVVTFTATYTVSQNDIETKQ